MNHVQSYPHDSSFFLKLKLITTNKKNSKTGKLNLLQTGFQEIS